MGHDRWQMYLSAFGITQFSETVNDLTPIECICKLQIREPHYFTFDPVHHIPSPKTVAIHPLLLALVANLCFWSD